VYRVPVRDTDELQQQLVVKWAEFQQNMVYDAIDQWQKDYRVGQKNGAVTIILSILNQFTKTFTGRFLGKFAVKWISKNPTAPCICCYTAL